METVDCRWDKRRKCYAYVLRALKRHDQLAAKKWGIIKDFDAALAFARRHFGIQTREPAAAAGRQEW